MAKSPTTSKSSDNLAELKQRLLFVLMAFIVFRIGSFIPVPGIDASVLGNFLNDASQSGNLLTMFNMFSGGALERASVFALGIMPYITASIIIQVMGFVDERLKQLKKEGEAGRKKLNQYTRYLTLVIATVQAVAMSTQITSLDGLPNLVPNPDFSFYFGAIVCLVTGTMFLMWLGEQINERGIGNGISMLIFAGIVAGLPSAVGQVFGQLKEQQLSVIAVLGIIALVVLVTFFIVWVERGQRRILVSYARRQQGRKVFAAQNSHLPLKINMAGVIPAIFASAIIMFPGTILQWFGQGDESLGWLRDITVQLSPGNPLYILLYAVGIIFFCFFYTALTMNPRETADNLKKSGAFIPGVRPGQQTSMHIDKIMTRLTLAGALYMTFVCILPELMILFAKVPLYLGGTAILIVVVVVMDFMAQVQAHLISKDYDSALKKANFKNYGSSGRIKQS